MPDIPTTKTEQYLAVAAGESTVMPDFPETKTHRYLQKIVERIEEGGGGGGGTGPSPSTASPLMDGTASAGASAAYARGDHRHPTDTSRLAANQGTANAGKFMVVGSDGVVTPVTMQTWQGGNY